MRRILEKWGESGKDVLDGFNVFFLKVINYLIRIFLYNLIKYSVMLCWFIYCDFVNNDYELWGIFIDLKEL